VKGFRAWLQKRFNTVAALNEAMHGHFSNFATVDPPSKDVLTSGGNPLMHIDPSAAGKIAIYGWAYDPSGKGVPLISVNIDGRKVGVMPADLNRPDVPEADPSVKTPNVGWRFDYDFRDLAAGPHTLELIAATADGKRVRFGGRRFIVIAPSGDHSHDLDRVNLPVGSATSEGLRLVIDGPRSEQKVLYNPMAEFWLEYRNQQVRRYYEQFAALVEQSCIPRDKVFSHQIAPELNPTWDDDIMAVLASQKPDALYSPGSTLYGGAAFGDAFFRLKNTEGWKTYSVPEFHPMFNLTVAQMEATCATSGKRSTLRLSLLSLCHSTARGAAGKYASRHADKTGQSKVWFGSLL
jgi:hypothetical protein